MNKVLKGLGVAILFIALCFLDLKLAYGLDKPAGFSGTVSTTYPYTSIVYSWTVMDSLNQANADSIGIFDASDSTFIATCDSVSQTSITLTGLVPNHTYIYTVVADSAGKAFGISTPDTTNTTALTFSITLGEQPNTFIDWTLTDMLDTTGVAADTLCIVTPADSTIEFNYTTLGRELTSGTVDGLSPNTQYIWAIAARSGTAAGTHILSNPDTVTTQGVDVDWDNWYPRSLAMQMRKATSYQASNVDTTYIKLYTEADAESTVVYDLATYTSVYGYVSGGADSCKFTALFYAGYAGNDAVESNGMDFVLSDSLNVTAAGPFSFGDSIDTLGPKAHGFVKFRADAGCGWITIYPRIGRESVVR